MGQSTCNCRECGSALDVFAQANSPRIGGFMEYVTCKNPACLLRGVTREINLYQQLTDDELESYRKMNRDNQVSV